MSRKAPEPGASKPMEQFSPGELQLVYDLAREFPQDIRMVTETIGDRIKVKLSVRRVEIAGFLDHLIKRLRYHRGQIEHCITLELEGPFGALIYDPSAEGEGLI